MWRLEFVGVLLLVTVLMQVTEKICQSAKLRECLKVLAVKVRSYPFDRYRKESVAP